MLITSHNLIALKSIDCYPSPFQYLTCSSSRFLAISQIIMPNDITAGSGGAVVAVAAATAAASVLSFLALTNAASKSDPFFANNGNGRHNLSALPLATENDTKNDDDTADVEEEDGEAKDNVDRRGQWYQSSTGRSKEDEESETNLRSTISTETGATAEGDDTVHDLEQTTRDIFGSASSVGSDGSDSDLSYDAESYRNSFKKSMKDFFDNDVSFTGLTIDENENETLDPDSPFSPCIYLDYNGTTPIDRRVFAAMIPYLTLHFGNPSSSHAYGTAPKRAISKARRSILELLYPNDCAKLSDEEVDESIIFTGCGTEADNMAIHLALGSSTTTTTSSSRQNKKRKKKHIVTTNVEHPAITECLKVLEAKGDIHVTYVPVNSDGMVSAKKVKKAINSETVLVTIMLANNESGALQPVKEIAPYCRQRGILFHTDAAQAVGKVSIALDDNGISDSDMVTIVGHKFGAPKGIACLYIRPGCLNENGRKEPTSVGYGSSGMLLHGGGQESGRRAGTENVPYIVGLGCAADILTAYTSKQKHRRWRKNASNMRSVRSRLLLKFKEAFQDVDDSIVRENGPSDPTKRLPNTLSIGFKNVQRYDLILFIEISF